MRLDIHFLRIHLILTSFSLNFSPLTQSVVPPGTLCPTRRPQFLQPAGYKQVTKPL